MKKIINTLLAGVMLTVASSCADLDLMPPADAAAETWFTNEQQFDMAAKDLYRNALWYFEGGNRYCNTDRWTEDWMQRETGYDWMQNAMSGKVGWVTTMWLNTYKAISRANLIINMSEERRGQGIPDAVLDHYEGEGRFFRACFYSYLTFLWGNIPYFEENLSIDQAYELGKNLCSRDDVIKKIYADFDKATKLLPDDAEGSRVCRATAYAFWCRTASWMLDYSTAKETAEACMAEKKYSLEKDYAHLFYPSTKTSPEFIFMIPGSVEYEQIYNMKSFCQRNLGFNGVKGTAVAGPSMEALLAYTLTDGLMADESPLYNPQKPWENMDPRCAMTIVLPGSEIHGVEYDLTKKKVKNYTTGKQVTNNDTRIVQQYAQYSGLLIRKGRDNSWLENGMDVDINYPILRYADILLMYAEACIEQGVDLDKACDAINQVRSRAYNGSGIKYPAVSGTDIKKLRKAYRVERHMEFMWENRHWFDLVRWRLCDYLNGKVTTGFPLGDPMQKAIDRGDYFFPRNSRPDIDENGLVDLTPIIEKAKENNGGKPYYVHPVKFVFDADGHQYLLPYPTEDVQLVFGHQNPGY